MPLSIAELFGLGAANSVNEQLKAEGSKAPKWLQAIFDTATGTFNALADIELREFEIARQREQQAEADAEAAAADARRQQFFGLALPPIDPQTAMIGIGLIVGLGALLLIRR